MENNKQDPKFKELSTKKKVIHYVGWPLLALGCVGTVVFGSLWCKARNSSGGCREINLTTEEWESAELDGGGGSASQVAHKVEGGAKSTDRFRLNIDFSILPSIAKRSDFELYALLIAITDLDPFVQDPDDPAHRVLTIDYGVDFFEDGEEVRPAVFWVAPWCEPEQCMPFNEGAQIAYWFGDEPSEETSFPHDLDIFNSVLSFEFSLFEDFDSDFYVSAILTFETTAED